MSSSYSSSAQQPSFRSLFRTFAADPGLPMADILPADQILQLCQEEGVSFADAQHQQGAPARRRSPEAVRSRLTGFQLGSRDAVQPDHATAARPLAGEENNR